jgi:UrcA family protein
MSKSVIGGLAAAFVLVAGAAAAQGVVDGLPTSGLPLQPPPQGVTVGEVIIEAPKLRERSRLGVEMMDLSMSVAVPYGDLDLKTPGGATELDRRITLAADYVCKQLERRYPEGSPETRACAREAVRDTRPQVIRARNSG